MRRLNLLAAVAATVLAGGSAVAAAEKPKEPGEKKICRTVEMPGRITPQKVCRKVPREDKAGAKTDKAPEGAGRAGQIP